MQARIHTSVNRPATHLTPAQKLGRMITEARTAAGLSNQAALAEALDTAQGLVSKWERGLHVPSSAHLARMINVLKLDPERVYELVYQATQQQRDGAA